MAVVDLLRYVAFGLALLSAAVATGSWAVRTRRINPFSRTARTIRRTTDPVLAPIERWLVRRGGNPQQAGWWLVGVAIVGGILVITVGQWLVVQGSGIAQATTGGPRALLRVLVHYASQLLLLAIVVRVIGSWFGVGRYTRWMRPFYGLTDWIVRPLQQVIPRFGMIDVTPIVAWIVILAARWWLLRLL